MSSPVGVKVVVAQDDDGVGFLERIFDDPGFADDPQDWSARKIQNGTQRDDEDE